MLIGRHYETGLFFFYLFAPKVGFIAVFTGRIRLDFPVSSYLDFSGVARFAPILLISALGLIGPSSAVLPSWNLNH